MILLSALNDFSYSLIKIFTKRRCLFIFILLFYSIKLNAQSHYLEKAITDFEARYDLHIVMDSACAVQLGLVQSDSTYQAGNVTVTLVGHTMYPQHRDTVNYMYIKFLDKEFAKYPTDYFKRIDLQYIVIGAKLFVGNTKRAAIPSWRSHTLLYEASYSILYDEAYMANVIHHELHHYAENALGNAKKYFKKWTKLNPKEFSYGYGGIMQFDPKYKNVDFGSHNHPKEGFISNYSMTGAEEDRAVLVALIMNERERHQLLQWLPTDERLQKKVQLSIAILNAISYTSSNYWTTVMEGQY